MLVKKETIYFYLALSCAVWFALTAAAWTYLANLFISLPFGILSLILWYKGKQVDTLNKRYKLIPVILVIGIIISLIALLFIK